MGIGKAGCFETSFMARFRMRKSFESKPGKITGEQYVRWGRIHDLTKVEIDVAGVPRDRKRLRTKESLRILWKIVEMRGDQIG